MLSPSLPFADGVPNSGWIIPQPTTEGWRPHIATIKAWLRTLKLKKILHQPLASQFVVVYLLIVVVTLNPRLVEKDQAWLGEMVDGYTKALEGLK